MYQYLLIKAILITNPADYYAPSYDSTFFKLYQSKGACYERLLVIKEILKEGSPEDVKLIVDVDADKSDVLIFNREVEGRINYYTCQKALIEEFNK